MKKKITQDDLQIEILEPMVLMSASPHIEGTDGDDTLVGQQYQCVLGLGGDDTITGVGDNQLDGGEGDDTFITGFGFNTIDGGEGCDTIRYADFNRADLQIILQNDGSIEISDGNKTDIVRNVETFEFKDQTLTLEDLQNDPNTAPVIETGHHLSVEENQTDVATIVASDADGDTLTFSLSDGSDSDLFEIDSATGDLTFKVAPDFENPGSGGGNNTYSVHVKVSDGNTTTLRTFWITVTDVDDGGATNNPPTFDNLNQDEVIEVAEGQTAVRDIDASDLDGDNLTFMFSDGLNTPGDGPNQDPGLFDLDSSTGVLTFKTAPDFEAPGDADTDNDYKVTIVVSDGQSAIERDITIRVTDVVEGGGNNAPTFDNLTEGEVIVVDEGTLSVRDIDASDLDGDTITYSFSDAVGTPGSGFNEDIGDFTLDPNTGALSFNVAPDFENPADADTNNDYLLTILISDGQAFVERNITVRVADVNEGSPNNAPSFTNVPEGGQATVLEGVTFVDDTNATDPDGDALTFSIVGGDDSGLFDIDAATGVVTFKSAPDFENPADADTNNVYELTLRVSDGDLFQDRNVTVRVLDRFESGGNNAPSFSNVEEGEIVTVPENTTLVGDADGSDPDGDQVTFSISGGADADLFNVDPNTGLVSFKVAPDFENAGDANGDNDYNITLKISDGTLFQERNVVVRVFDITEDQFANHPRFTNLEAGEIVTVPENTTFVGDADAVDPNGDAITFSIVGGADAGKFTVNAQTGVVSFLASPDFENPGDANGDNNYNIVLRVTDSNGLWQQKEVVVRVFDVNEGQFANHPRFTNVEAGEIVTVPENSTFVGDADAVDPNGDAITFSIVGGADAGKFTVNAQTGVVSFLAAPDFENPGDANGDNNYNIVLRVTDSNGLWQQKEVVVRVFDVSENQFANHPRFTNVEAGEIVTVPENSTFVGDADAVDPNGDAITFSIVGGADAGKFTVNAQTGVVSFLASPDFENPGDANGDNNYNIVLRVTDSNGLWQQKEVVVRVFDVNEDQFANHPRFTNVEAGEIVTVPENSTFVGDADAVDPNGDAITFSIVGGADAGKFTVNAQTGVVSFLAAPDFENPGDANGDNNYNIVLRVTDSNGLWQQKEVVVRVFDISEDQFANHPRFTNVEAGEIVTVPENSTFVGDADAVDPNGDAITFSIVGGADASLFTVNAQTGVVSFLAAPDFESPGDANGDNNYNIVLRVTDSNGLWQQKEVVVRVFDVNEDQFANNPRFTNVEPGEVVTVHENSTLVGDADAVDPNGDAITFSIVGGADASLFTVNAQTGVVSFLAAPDFENPGDANGDNDYSIVLRVTDSNGLFQQREVVVRIIDEAEDQFVNHPRFTNVEAGEIVTVPENTTFVGDADAVDPNGDAITFSIVGGADASKFTVDAQTGVVSFVAAPDFENPGDANSDNNYNIVLRVTDSNGLWQQKEVVVRVFDVNEDFTNQGPSFTNVEQNEVVTVVDGNTLVGDADATDPNGDTLTFSVVGGVDGGKFSINSATGELTFVSAPDFSNPADADGDNDYQVRIRVSDGSLSQDRDVVVRVIEAQANGAPAFSNVSENEVVWLNENNTFIGDANAADPDGDPISFSIAGGADASFFQINSQTGELFFINAPDFEHPQDDDGDNRYEVILRVSDGSLFEDRKVLVDIRDVADA